MDRSGNRVVVPVMVRKDTSWQEGIVQLCIDSLESGNIPDPEVEISVTDIYDLISNILFSCSFQLKMCLPRDQLIIQRWVKHGRWCMMSINTIYRMMQYCIWSREGRGAEYNWGNLYNLIKSRNKLVAKIQTKHHCYSFIISIAFRSRLIFTYNE